MTVEEAAARIRARNPVLNAFVTTRLDEALALARTRSEAVPRSPLHGLPYGLKDSWDTAGLRTTGGSWRFRDRVPETSAPMYEAFEDAGAVLMGKTNLSDLALAPEATSWVGGATNNPHDLTRTAGGSSGGAACAVADRMIAFDWGSDIGGSIRTPAAYCGVWGLRLSSETWPLHGDFPSPPPSLQYMNGQGPIAGSAGMLRDVLRVTAPRMRTGPVRRFDARGAVLWAPGEPGKWPTFVADVEPALRAAAGEVRTGHGLPSPSRARNLAGALWASHFEDLLSVDPIPVREGVAAALSATFLRGRFGDRRFHPLTAEILLLIVLGRFTLFRDRARAVRNANAFRAQISELWDRGWLIVMPTALYPAPRHGGTFWNWGLLACVMPGNVADATAVAMPFGRFDDGLPRSLQIMGPPGSEDAVLDLAERIAAAGRVVP